MNDFYSVYPVEVIIKESSVAKARTGLMYCIYPDDTGVPCATCWMVDSNSWLTIPLAYVTPKLEIIKKITINETL